MFVYLFIYSFIYFSVAVTRFVFRNGTGKMSSSACRKFDEIENVDDETEVEKNVVEDSDGDLLLVRNPAATQEWDVITISQYQACHSSL